MRVMHGCQGFDLFTNWIYCHANPINWAFLLWVFNFIPLFWNKGTKNAEIGKTREKLRNFNIQFVKLELLDHMNMLGERDRYKHT